MPHKNPEDRNRRDRERRAEKRAAALVALPPDEPPDEPSGTGGPAPVAPLPVRNARDLLAVLGEQINACRADRHTHTQARARTLGYLVAVALRAVEVCDITDRLAAVEAALKMRANEANAGG